MKQKIFTNKFKLLLVFAFMILIGQTLKAEAIVGWTLLSNNISNSGVVANTGSTFSHSSAGTITNNSQGAQIAGWDVADSYWTTSAFSTVDHINVAIAAQMKSESGIGPRDFQLQYKIGDGEWTNAGSAISLSVSQISIPTINLPAECSNQTSLTLRFLNTSDVSVGGGTVDETGLTMIRNFEVSGDLPLAPTTQAAAISLVSVTPTTIQVTVNTGNGSHWILAMNTTNSFTAPAAGSNPSANLVYGGGDQVMVNDIQSVKTFTVTVPSATNEYWFRAYAYNYNDGMTRFNETEVSPSNPKLCALETIILPTSTTIRLTTAFLGATISTPLKGIISERGVFFGYSPGVTHDNTLKVDVGNTGSGIYSFDVTGLARSRTIYYRGYVVNESGMILSEEASFSNIPIFSVGGSDTGTWETASLWNVQQVPGTGTTFGASGDKPEINGICTLNTTTTVNTLTINATKTLNIGPAASMTAATLDNNGGTAGLVIQANSSGANGSLKWTNPIGNSEVGTVEMWSKAHILGIYPARNRWQYFGIPVTSLTLGNTFASADERVRKYNEASGAGADAVGLWEPADATHTNLPRLNNSTIMVPVDGYEVVQPAAKKYSFEGTLNHIAVNKSLTYTEGEYSGSHILANPFTAAINVSGITYTGAVEHAVYIYNTGSLQDWANNSGSTTPGSNPGTYSVSTGGFAGIFGVPAQIPSMQGFLVKTTAAGSSIGMPLTALTTNLNPQRAPQSEDSEKVATMIDVIGTSTSDRMWIFSEETCTPKFDNGFDGPKILGSALNTQLYSMGEDGDYQINAVSDINNTYLGFQAGQERNLKMVFTHQNMDSKYGGVYLVDLVANKTIDITASGTEYAFTTEATPVAVKRFKIITQTTENNNSTASQLKLVNTKSGLIISNPTNEAGSLVVYNLSGGAIHTVRFDANELVTIPMNLGKGIYVAKAKTSIYEVTEKLIIR